MATIHFLGALNAILKINIIVICIKFSHYVVLGRDKGGVSWDLWQVPSGSNLRNVSNIILNKDRGCLSSSLITSKMKMGPITSITHCYDLHNGKNKSFMW